MAGMSLRNSPFSPFSEKTGVSEILHSPYRGEEENGGQFPAGKEIRLLDSLLIAAMRACDHHGDGIQAREQMKRDCLATPLHLRADLFEHFKQTYEGRGS